VREIAEAWRKGRHSPTVGRKGPRWWPTRRLTHRCRTRLPLDTLCAWAVSWIRGNGRLLNKPTKFEVRDGKF
jgi:hypothetical protein